MPIDPHSLSDSSPASGEDEGGGLFNAPKIASLTLSNILQDIMIPKPEKLVSLLA
jgi:hypothetical protein